MAKIRHRGEPITVAYPLMPQAQGISSEEVLWTREIPRRKGIPIKMPREAIRQTELTTRRNND